MGIELMKGDDRLLCEGTKEGKDKRQHQISEIEGGRKQERESRETRDRAFRLYFGDEKQQLQQCARINQHTMMRDGRKSSLWSRFRGKYVIIAPTTTKNKTRVSSSVIRDYKRKRQKKNKKKQNIHRVGCDESLLSFMQRLTMRTAHTPSYFPVAFVCAAT